MFHHDPMITSPHNDKLKEVRKLACSARRDERALRRRGRGPARRGRRRRAGGRSACCAAGGSTSSRGAAATRSLAWARARGRWGSTSSAGRAPAGPLCVALWGVDDPGQRRHGAALARSPSARARSRSAPARADPFGAEGRARRHGRHLRRAGPARATVERAARRRGRARRAREGAPLARARGAGDARASAPSARGCRRDVVAGCDASRHIPIAARVAQRGDGGHCRAVRARRRIAAAMIDRIDAAARGGRGRRSPRPHRRAALEELRVRYLGPQGRAAQPAARRRRAAARAARHGRQGRQRRPARRSRR